MWRCGKPTTAAAATKTTTPAINTAPEKIKGIDIHFEKERTKQTFC